MQKEDQIALIDDDAAVLDALSTYLRKCSFEVTSFANAQAFLEVVDLGRTFTCVVSDVRMPGMSGLELQQEIIGRSLRCEVILATGYGDIPTAVSAVKAGAFDFFEKPFDEERLADSIRAAAAKVNAIDTEVEYVDQIRARVDQLSERQREVMILAAQGYTNKEIARKMQIGTRTVESYRAWVMERTGARNLADLIRMAMRLGMAP